MSHRRPRSRRPPQHHRRAGARHRVPARVPRTAGPHPLRDRPAARRRARPPDAPRGAPALRRPGQQGAARPGRPRGTSGRARSPLRRVGCGELFDQILDAAEAHHRGPTSEDPDEPDVADDGPFEPHECGGFILGLRRRFHTAEQVAVCEVTLHDLVDPEEVRVEDLGTEFARINVSLRQPGTVPTAHTALIPAWANILKPAAGENRVATSPVDVQIIHPGDHGVTHLTLLFAQSTAPALAVPVTRPPAPAARPDNVVPFEKGPRAKGNAAPPPSAG